VKAVLLDALGTLLELEDPGPPLAEELARRGAPVAIDDARAAVLAEMTYYRAHHDEASDRARLADLRRRCAEVLSDALPPAARALGIGALTEALLAALRFRPYAEVPDALRELRGAGLRLVVLSNWDVSLHDQLAATGLDELVDGAISSAEAGFGKPNPAIFAKALERAGAAAGDALMVGDSADTDVAGAHGAGIAAVLVDRWGAAPAGLPPGTHVIASLAELPGLVRSLA
jgi:putative hydrolase of the HAD superfamily